MVFSEEGLFCRPRQNYQTKFRADLKAYATYTFDTAVESGLRAFFTRLLDFSSKCIFVDLVRAIRTCASERRDVTNKLIVVCPLPPSSVQPARPRGLRTATMARQALQIRPFGGPFEITSSCNLMRPSRVRRLEALATIRRLAAFVCFNLELVGPVKR